MGEIIEDNAPNEGFEIALGVPEPVGQNDNSEDTEEELGYGAPVWQSKLFTSRSKKSIDKRNEKNDHQNDIIRNP